MIAIQVFSILRHEELLLVWVLGRQVVVDRVILLLCKCLSKLSCIVVDAEVLVYRVPYFLVSSFRLEMFSALQTPQIWVHGRCHPKSIDHGIRLGRELFIHKAWAASAVVLSWCPHGTTHLWVEQMLHIQCVGLCGENVWILNLKSLCELLLLLEWLVLLILDDQLLVGNQIRLARLVGLGLLEACTEHLRRVISISLVAARSRVWSRLLPLEWFQWLLVCSYLPMSLKCKEL